MLARVWNNQRTKADRQGIKVCENMKEYVAGRAEDRKEGQFTSVPRGR